MTDHDDILLKGLIGMFIILMIGMLLALLIEYPWVTLAIVGSIIGLLGLSYVLGYLIEFLPERVRKWKN